jgi:hypothetical protein
MKKANDVFTAILVALAFGLAPGAEATPRPDGGPTRSSSTVRAIATNEAALQLGISEDILPLIRINFAPVGLTMSQTARLNLVNMDAANGITLSWRFIDANGAILAQSSTTLTIGKIFSVDFKRHSDPLPGESPEQLRAEVLVQLDILTYGVSSDSLRRSLEVFDNSSGATTVYMAGGL